MHRAATNSLIFTDLSSFLSPTTGITAQVGAGGLYQVVIKAAHNESRLRLAGTRLVAVLEQAHAFRRTDIIEATSKALLSMPGSLELESIGRFYHGLCVQRRGKRHLDHAARLLENVAEHAPAGYRVRAMISLGTNAMARGDSRAALWFNVEALSLIKRARLTDYPAFVRAQNDIAVFRSLDGDHVEALTLLNGSFPIAKALRTTHPHIYFEYLNNLAVELNEIGHFEEAAYACDLALASPFAHAYPEWHETRQEIELRKRTLPSRTSVAFGHRENTQFCSKNNTAARTTQSHNLQGSRDQLPIAWPETRAARADGNLLRMPLPEQNPRPFAAPPSDSTARGRVLEFASRTRSPVEENEECELDASESRKTIADKLYEMLIAAIDDLVEFDLDLLESLYRDYLQKRLNA